MSDWQRPFLALVTVDPALPVPAYEQIRAQIATAIASGILVPGAELPSVRQLARDLALAPNTIVRAYAELEHDGWVRAEPRRGVMVLAQPPIWSETERRARLEQAAGDLLATARRLGYATEDVIATLRALAGKNPPTPQHNTRDSTE